MNYLLVIDYPFWILFAFYYYFSRVNAFDNLNAWSHFLPGFESSLESRHVMEITEKLANFNIETDTDVNQSDGGKDIVFLHRYCIPSQNILIITIICIIWLKSVA